jgi:glycosyltransferase involved in cell wall biosynthesis
LRQPSTIGERMFSVVIPVYLNESFVPSLIRELAVLSDKVKSTAGLDVECVFVVDGSPDESYARLLEALPESGLRAQIVLHSRNFGSFAAIRTGLAAARGDYFGVIAADLQEPPDLLLQFLQRMTNDGFDVVVGTRASRDDPWMSTLLSRVFWGFYRRFVVRELPSGGVDVFGCNSQFRDELLNLEESNSSLVAQLFWLGFSRTEVPYRRRKREHGKSGWSLWKRLKYLQDSIFAFTDLPIRLLTLLGLLGLIVAIGFGLTVLLLRVFGGIDVPGYATTVIVIAFFGALNTFGLGIVGTYAWRAFENTKRRPLAIVQRRHVFDPKEMSKTAGEAT